MRGLWLAVVPRVAVGAQVSCLRSHADGSCTCHLADHVRQLLPRRYRHYKGGVYLKLLEALHEDTGATMVVYQGEDGKVWVRPYDLFHGKVVHGKDLVDRFELIE